MIFREARISDITQMHVVRVAVKENILPDPGMITAEEYQDYISNRGKGWVCELNNEIVGFSIVSIKDKNVWALFVKPGFENKGIGRKLHDEMLNWYFSNTDETIWLGTAPRTRAEQFYRRTGWKEIKMRPNGEIQFEMAKTEWEKLYL